MANIPDLLWNQRYTQLQNELRNYIKSIYTWAIIANKTIEELEFWAQNKTHYVTNAEPSRLSINKEKILIKQIVELFFDTPVNELAQSKTIAEATINHSNNGNTEEIISLFENEAPVASKYNEYLDRMQEEHDKEDQELADHIKERRALFEKEQQELEHKRHEEESRQKNFKIDGQSLEQSNDLTKIHSSDQVASAEAIRIIEGTLPASKFNSAEKAPTINALYRLSLNERERLLEKLFIEAGKNIENNTKGMSLSYEDKEELRHKEMDRLVENWIQTH